MDPKLKIVLVAVGGVLVGMLLLGTAFAVPAAFHLFAGGPVMTQGQAFGPGMMNRGPVADERGFANGGTCPNYEGGTFGGPGMMGGRGQGGFNGGCTGGACGQGACGEQGCVNGEACPNATDGTCPNAVDGTCPNAQDTTGTSL